MINADFGTSVDGTQEFVFQAQERVKTTIPDCVMAGGWTRKGTITLEHLSAPSPGILVLRIGGCFKESHGPKCGAEYCAQTWGSERASRPNPALCLWRGRTNASQRNPGCLPGGGGTVLGL